MAIPAAAAAAYRARTAPTDQLIAEAIGGLIGGWVGGVLPDILEPATSPNHRRVAHSAAAGGALALVRIAEWQASCRAAADAAVTRALAQPVGSPERESAEWDVLFWRLLAGILVGLVAGYLVFAVGVVSFPFIFFSTAARRQQRYRQREDQCNS